MSKLVIQLAGDLNETPNLEELTFQRLPTGQLLLMTATEAAIVTGVTVDGSSKITTRHNVRKGSDHPNSRLTEADVRSIRRRYVNGESAGVIAKDTGMKLATIYGITSGRTWQHVTADAEEAA